MKIMGIDASLTGTGVVVLGGELQEDLIYCQRYSPKKNGVDRLIEIEEYIATLLSSMEPDLVTIEGYSYASANQAHQIGELGGVIRRLLKVAGQKWKEIAPSQVKKFATGKGNCKKDLVLMQVYKRWGQEFKTSDEADAFVLAKIGASLVNGYNGEEGLTAYQREVIEKIRKGKV